MKSAGSEHVAATNRQFFTRDINYLRDLALFWPFTISTLIAAGALSSSQRELGLRLGAVAFLSLILASERLVLFFAALGFTAIRCGIALILHPWSWGIFIVGVLTAIPFAIANKYWRKPRLKYRWPNELGAVDVLLTFASICGTLFVVYLINPNS